MEDGREGARLSATPELEDMRCENLLSWASSCCCCLCCCLGMERGDVVRKLDAAAKGERLAGLGCGKAAVPDSLVLCLASSWRLDTTTAKNSCTSCTQEAGSASGRADDFVSSPSGSTRSGEGPRIAAAGLCACVTLLGSSSSPSRSAFLLRVASPRASRS